MVSLKFFRLIIHNNSLQLMQSSGDAIFLSPGFEASLKINRVFTNKLSKPYSSCKVDLDKESDFNSILFKSVLSYNYCYRQKDCFDLCLSKYMIDNCNATIKLSYSMMINVNDQECFSQKRDQFFEMNVFYFPKKD